VPSCVSLFDQEPLELVFVVADQLTRQIEPDLMDRAGEPEGCGEAGRVDRVECCVAAREQLVEERTDDGDAACVPPVPRR
jgi:hypothetical protein